MSRARPFESKVQLLALYNLCFRSCSTLLYLSLITMLLKSSGPGALPWLYTATNVILLLVNHSIPSGMRHLLSVPFLRLSPIPLMGLTLCAGITSLTSANPLVTGAASFLFLILLSNVDELWCLSFANSLGRILTLAESKKWQASIYGMGSLGQFLSGISLKLLLDFMNLGHLLILNALFALGAISLAHRILTMANRLESENSRKDISEEPQSDQAVHKGPSLSDSIAQPMVKLLMIAALLRIFTKYPVDFIFSGAVNQRFSTPESMAAFLGIFSAVSDLGAIVLQSCVSGWLMQRFPLGRLLSILPVSMIVLSFWSALGGGFLPAVVMQLFLGLMSRALFIPGRNILMGSLPSEDREHHNRSLFVSRTIGTLMAGTLLIFVGSRAPVWSILAFLCLVYALMLKACTELDQAYLTTLKSTLTNISSFSPADRENGEDSGFEETTALEAMTLALISDPELIGAEEDPFVRAELLENLRFSEPLVEMNFTGGFLLGEEHPRCARVLAHRMASRARELGSEGETLELEFLQRFIKKHDISSDQENSRLLADLLEGSAAGLCGKGKEALYESMLRHANPRVRAAAISSVLKCSLDREAISGALMVLSGMVKSKDLTERSAAAAIMGEIGIPSFAPSLARLAECNEDITARAAMRALARTRTPWALTALRRAAFRTPGDRGAWARDLFMEASRESAARVASLLLNMTTGEREHLGKMLRGVKDESALDLMSRILGIEDTEIRRILASRVTIADSSERSLLSSMLGASISGSTTIHPEPLLSRILAQDFQANIPWIGMISSSDCFERLEFEKALDQAATGDVSISNHQLETLFSLISGMGQDRIALLRALEEIDSSDPFKKAIAIEYVSGNLGQNLCLSLERLLEKINLENR